MTGGVVPVELEALVRQDVDDVSSRAVFHVLRQEPVEIFGVHNPAPNPGEACFAAGG